MTIVSWDSANNTDVTLCDKQLESVHYLSSYDFDSNIESNDAEQKSDALDDVKTFHIASQFYTWLYNIEKTHTKISDDQRDFIHYVDTKKEECNTILDTIDKILSNLDLLESNYQSISQKTNELHELCEDLLKQQNDLTESANLIEQNLIFYKNVDSVYSDLSVSNFIVSRENLVKLLQKLDSSISYFQQHMDYLESAVYLNKAHNLLSKILDIIKFNITRLIDKITHELTDCNNDISPDNSFIFLYGKFRSHASKIRPMMSVLEERANTNEKRYTEVINECHEFYLKQREDLLIPITEAGIRDLIDKYTNDHCALMRTIGAFMMNMCGDEMKLFNQFFYTHTGSIGNMLSHLCRCVYDAIRPRIIHVNHIELLSEMCDILKYELRNDTETTDRPDLKSFSELLDALLADVQERLIFRSHLYINSEIIGFLPSSGDISYPEKLDMMNAIAESLTGSKEQESDSDISIKPGLNMSLAPADLHGMWYPTVRRTLVCLSKLSRCLYADSFRSLAQECVSGCIQSLLSASQSISERSTILDGQLFFIKHLLILREQTISFNVEFLVKETSLDFSTYKNMALDIWEQKGSRLFALNKNNAFLRFILETPNAVDVELDSRRQLDHQLRSICESLIEQQIFQLTKEMSQFLKRAEDVLASPDAKLIDQPFASVSSIKDLVSRSYRLLSHTLGRRDPNIITTPTSTTGGGGGSTVVASSNNKNNDDYNLRKSLHLYLANPGTETILIRRIQTGVINCWRFMFQLIMNNYSDEDRLIIACPTENQIRLLFQDIYAPGQNRRQTTS